MSAEIRRLLADDVRRLNALVTQWREDAGRREPGRTDYRLSEREMAVYQKCANQLEQLAALLAAPAVPVVEKLINTKGDVEAACRLDARGERDYLAYAAHQLRGAIEKRDDAPCSSSEHEMAARVALNLERVPTYPEIVNAWKATAVVAVPAPQEDVLRKALEAIAAGHPAGDCGCTHDDENCCAKVGEWCAVCLAATGLAAVPAQEEATTLNPLTASADEIERFKARLCGRCGCRADQHIHLYGTQRHLCPTVGFFRERDDDDDDDLSAPAAPHDARETTEGHEEKNDKAFARNGKPEHQSTNPATAVPD